MSSTLNTVEILSRLKEIYELKTDKQLAEHLSIPYTTLNSWKTINKVNWDIINDKCPNISWDYLRNGTGSPFVDNQIDESQNNTDRKVLLEKELFIDNYTRPDPYSAYSKEEWRQMFFRIISRTDPTKDDTPHEKVSILFVDDEEHNLHSFRANFRKKYRIITAKSGAEALQLLEDFDIDIIITDQKMPEMTGIEFLEKAILIKPDTMRILMTAYTQVDVVTDAINKGKIYYYLDKPWKNDEIDQIITLAYAVYIERKKNKIKTDELEKLNEQYEFFLRQKLNSLDL